MMRGRFVPLVTDLAFDDAKDLSSLDESRSAA